MKFDTHKFVMLAILWSVLALAIIEQARGMFGFPPLITSAFFLRPIVEDRGPDAVPTRAQQRLEPTHPV